MTNMQYALMVLVMAAVTAALRFLPFLVFGGMRETPPFVAFLGRVLPCAVIGMLVIFCFKNVSLLSSPFGAPEWIAGAVVVGLHVWRRNTLLSILAGTATYMLLVQLVF